MLKTMSAVIRSQRGLLERGVSSANQRYALSEENSMMSLMHYECMLSVDSDPSLADGGRRAITAQQRAVCWPATHTVRTAQALTPAGEAAYALLRQETECARAAPMLVSRFASSKVNATQYAWLRDHASTVGWAFDLPKMLQLLQGVQKRKYPDQPVWNGVGVTRAETAHTHAERARARALRRRCAAHRAASKGCDATQQCACSGRARVSCMVLSQRSASLLLLWRRLARPRCACVHTLQSVGSALVSPTKKRGERMTKASHAKRMRLYDAQQAAISASASVSATASMTDVRHTGSRARCAREAMHACAPTVLTHPRQSLPMHPRSTCGTHACRTRRSVAAALW